MPSKKKHPETIDSLRPYQFHGVMFSEDGDHPKADCPFCGKEGKFSVTLSKGTWGCFVCGEKGNLYTFIRRLWEESNRVTGNETSKAFARERGLLDSLALDTWGVAQSVLDSTWMVPGYNREGKLVQLYKRFKIGTKDGKPRFELRPTPTLPHAMHGVQLWDKAKPVVYVHESWGNALAFWEVLRQARQTDEGLRLTASEGSSLLANANVVAVANCGAVGKSLTPFLPLLMGKQVVLMFDNDHPRDNNGTTVEGAGYLAARRLAGMLSGGQHKAESLSWLAWSGNDVTHDSSLPSGWDVRDALVGNLQVRVENLGVMLGKVRPIPADWLPGRTGEAVHSGSTEVSPLPCSSWKSLLNSWRRAFHCRKGIEDVMAVMLAVACSTSQKGDQVFLQVLGDAGSGKTQIAEGMMISKTCYSLEQITSFTSGWKGEDGEDISLLAQMNHKTLITPEADVMTSNPKYAQIMGQCRRIFDGSFVARWGNRKEALKYQDLRTPWIQLGTPAMLDTDQSRLGDRFIKVYLDQPSDEDRRHIIRKAIYTEGTSLLETSNGDGGGTVSPVLQEAKRLTAGYVDWLRGNAEDLLARVHFEDDHVVDGLADLAEFVAFMRARPHKDESKLEKHDTKELPTRLGKQFRRLASCLAVVLNRNVDDEVLRIVRKVALDTSKGVAYYIAASIISTGGAGASVGHIVHETNTSENGVRTMLKFMRTIGAADKSTKKVGGQTQTKWVLTPRMRKLWNNVVGAE